MIIDFHVHCFSDDIAEKAITTLSKCGNIPARTDGTLAGIRQSMKKAGVGKSVIMNIATKPGQVVKINRWAMSISSDDIIPFGTVHPGFEDWENELEIIREAGLKGIKLHPDYQEFYVDSPELFPIYEKAAELGLVVLFHAGLDIGLPPPYHCTPGRMRNVVRAFPEAKLVAAHMGGYDYWDEVERCLAGENLYFDTSYSLHRMSRDQFLRIVSRHGFDKILFGTDSPWKDQSEEVERLLGMKLPGDAADAILGGNAARLLGLTW
ncbi:MAG: amidohydrolase family protein [Bacillota bacterium]